VRRRIRGRCLHNEPLDLASGLFGIHDIEIVGAHWELGVSIIQYRWIKLGAQFNLRGSILSN
jgi:hypothetical protein